MARLSFFLKIFIFILLIVMIISLDFQPVFKLNNCSGNNDYSNINYTEHLSNTEPCYGVVIPLINEEAIPYTNIQQSISNMINDFLRLNISVFWAASNFSLLTTTLSNDSTQIRYFEQGTFLVPFTRNNSRNAFIISIATDYEEGSEIETHYPVTMFFIMEPLSIDAYQLHYAKCALMFGLNIGYGDVYAYSDTLYSSGFLDTKLLLDNEICQKLNNNDFNLIIWPGGLNIKVRTFFQDVTVTVARSIRDFVNNGGGYVGSCYGAYAASSGPFLPFFLPLTYLRNFPAIAFLVLTSDSGLIVNCGAFINVTLVNRSHPVSFGLNPIQESFHWGGPVFTGTTINQNTQVLGVLKDFEVEWWRNPLSGKLPPEKFINFLIGKPIWISSYFGKGKVVVFGDHPEFHFPKRQDRIIDNTIFYVTSDKKTTIQFESQVQFSEITIKSLRTRNINLPTYQLMFSEIWNNIHILNTTGKKIDNELLNMTVNIFRLNEERNNTKEFPSNSHDFYQQWIQLFSNALMKLEQVYSLTKNTSDISSVVLLWRNRTNIDFQALKNYSRRLDENLTVLLRNLQYYIGSPTETKQLINLLNTVELLYREGHQILNQLWSSTVKTYRNCWYTYESELTIKVLATNEISTMSFEQQNLLVYQKNKPETNQILYVDDNAFNGGDGSLEHPFRNIQDAIDASSDGDSIFVHKGIYYEHLYISKSITLTGEQTNTTIIDGQNRPYHLIAITKPNVELTNFTIQNSVNLKCGVVLYSSNNLIKGNIVKNNGMGLGFSTRASNNTITGNQFIHNLLYGIGIDCEAQRNNCIEKNIFRENNIGLYTVNTNNIIRDNFFIDDGIYFTISCQPLIVEIINNTVNEKPLLCYKNLNNFHITHAGSIILSNCSNGVIENTIINNTETGIYIINSSNIQILHCTLYSNLISIALASSTNIEILHNKIINSRWSGIWLFESDKNKIFNSSISQNKDGIYLSSSTYNTIKNNNISNNILGLSCWSSSDKNDIVNTNFISNFENAFDQCRNQWQDNYWSDWIGLQNSIFTLLPYHIHGRISINFDRHPAEEPYDIPNIK